MRKIAEKIGKYKILSRRFSSRRENFHIKRSGWKSRNLKVLWRKKVPWIMWKFSNFMLFLLSSIWAGRYDEIFPIDMGKGKSLSLSIVLRALIWIKIKFYGKVMNWFLLLKVSTCFLVKLRLYSILSLLMEMMDLFMGNLYYHYT